MADNPTVSNELVLRCQFASYMKCASDGEFHLIGEGFTSFPIALNPVEYSRKYINYKTTKTDVIGYAPSVSYSCDCIKGDPVVEDIVALTDAEALGTDTHREIVSVNLWDKDDDGKCKAYKRTWAIIPGNKGDGTDAMVYAGTMKAVSDQVEGTFDPATNTFTEKAAAVEPAAQTT